MKQFGYIVADGTARETTLDEAIAACGRSTFVWMHLDANDPATPGWLGTTAGLSDIVVNALVATETRPRCDQIGEGALINLRGLARDPESLDDALASIRMWAEQGRVISVGRHELAALPAVIARVEGLAVVDPGDLISDLTGAITDELDPDVADLGDQLDDCEVLLDTDRAFSLRRRIARARIQAIAYRRFVVPQRLALERLAALPCDWLEERDRLRLTEAADRFARMGEELESVRERAALMHEQVTDLRAEVIETRALLISVVALIFLPLTFLTGLLGMNVEGIPYAHEPWAFWGVVGVCFVSAAAIAGYFIREHWFRR
jgi:zinc transporter